MTSDTLCFVGSSAVDAAKKPEMGWLGRTAVGAVWLALALSGTACQASEDPADMGGSGGGTSEGVCGGPEEAPRIESGKLAAGGSGGMSFVPFSTDPGLTIISGSQAASGVPVEFELANISLPTITRVEAKLIADQAPIGIFEDTDPVFSCADGVSQYEAMILLDVTDHPTVNNIIVLDQRDVILDYKISAGDQVLAEDLVTVRLTF